MTLGLLKDIYADKRCRQEGSCNGKGFRKTMPKLFETTITDHMMTFRYLIQFFGEQKVMNTVTTNQAGEWIEALAANELAEARNQKIKRVYGMTEQTVRGHIRNVKAIFTWAKYGHCVTDNPFDEYDGTPIETDANYYVPLADFNKLLAEVACPHQITFYWLQRLAGLRRGEALEFPWKGVHVDTKGERHDVGVEWQKARLKVMGRNKKVRKYREIPIRPALMELLREAHDRSQDDKELISKFSHNNLISRVQKYSKAAGLTVWADAHQSLRTSCENDLKTDGVP